MTTTLEKPVKRRKFPMTEAVREIVALAYRRAAREKAPSVQGGHYLLAILQTSRLFSRHDAILKELGLYPRKALRAFPKDKGFSFSIPAKLQDSILEHAYAISQQRNKRKVDVEHLLLALLASDDPLALAVLGQAEVTPEKLDAAVAQVDESVVQRLCLYFFREVVEVLLVVMILLIVIKQGLGEFRLIPSESMLPNLHVGDRIFVEKLSHWVHKPQRGDIIVFYPPEPESILKHDPLSILLRLTGFSGLIYNKESRIDTAFIKRLIGVPGDMVDVRPGEGVFINGKRIEEPYTAEIANTCTFINMCGPAQVPPHMYFMMGDNRNHSADSRFWGFLPEDRVIGRAVFRFYPLDSRWGVLHRPVYKSP